MTCTVPCAFISKPQPWNKICDFFSTHPKIYFSSHEFWCHHHIKITMWAGNTDLSSGLLSILSSKCPWNMSLFVFVSLNLLPCCISSKHYPGTKELPNHCLICCPYCHLIIFVTHKTFKELPDVSQGIQGWFFCKLVPPQYQLEDKTNDNLPNVVLLLTALEHRIPLS